MSESIKALLAQKWKDSGLFDALSSKASEKKNNNKTTDDDDDDAKRNEESLSNVSTTNGDDTLSDDKTITHSNNNNTIITPEKRRRDTTEPKTQQPSKKQKKMDEYTENLNVAKRIVDIKYESTIFTRRHANCDECWRQCDKNLRRRIQGAVKNQRTRIHIQFSVLSVSTKEYAHFVLHADMLQESTRTFVGHES